MDGKTFFELDPLAYLIDSPDPWLDHQEYEIEGEVAAARRRGGRGSTGGRGGRTSRIRQAKDRARAAIRDRQRVQLGSRAGGVKPGKRVTPGRLPIRWGMPAVVIHTPPAPSDYPRTADTPRNGDSGGEGGAGSLPTPDVEPEPLQQGSELIRWAQATLNHLHGLNLPEDGMLNPPTRSALRSFQRKHGLLDDGTLGPDTQQALTRERQKLAPQQGEFTSLEAEGMLSDLLQAPGAVLSKLRQGLEAQGVRLAVQMGQRDPNQLTNLVFYTRHPERAGQKLRREDPRFTELSREWMEIHSRLVQPALSPGLSRPAASPAAPLPGLPPAGLRLVSLESPGGGRIQNKRPPAASDLVTVQGVGGKRVQLQRHAGQAWQALVAAARAAGFKEPLFLPTSGYRDPAHQGRLWKNALQKYGSPQEARKWVAPPGGSAHQTGRAIDFYLGGKNSSANVDGLRALPTYRWLAANAVRYGFYPYPREPWHWEYNPPASAQEIFPRSEELEDAFEDEGAYWPGAGEGEPEGEDFFLDRLSDLFKQPVVSTGEQAVLENAIRAGQRDVNALTSALFYARHPERGKRKLARSEPGFERLSQEWLNIRDTLVRPALSRLSPQPASHQPKPQSQNGECQSSPLAWAKGVLAKMTYWWNDRNYLRSAKKVVENVPVGSSLRRMAPQVFPNVPPQAFAGFCANGGVTENTTECPPGAPANAICRRQRFHEMGLFGIEGGLRDGPAPNPDPGAKYNHWGKLAGHPLVVQILGRGATMKHNAWKTAIADQAAVGLVNLLEAGKTVAGTRKLDSRIRPQQLGSLYFVACSFMAWSAGGGNAVAHLNKVAGALAAVPENRRWGAFLKAIVEGARSGALRLDGLTKHNSPAYSALRTCQKLAAGKLLAEKTGGNTAWFDTGLGSEEAEILATITELGNRACKKRA